MCLAGNRKGSTRSRARRPARRAVLATLDAQAVAPLRQWDGTTRGHLEALLTGLQSPTDLDERRQGQATVVYQGYRSGTGHRDRARDRKDYRGDHSGQVRASRTTTVILEFAFSSAFHG